MSLATIDAVVTAIKHSAIVLCAYYVYIIAMPQRRSRAGYVAGAMTALLLGCSMYFLKERLTPMHLPFLLVIFYVIMGIMFRVRMKQNLTQTILGFGVSYAAFYLTVAASTFAIAGLSYLMAPCFGSAVEAMDYLGEVTTRHPIFYPLTITVLESVQCALVFLLMKNKRIRKGISALVRFGLTDVGTYLSVTTLSIMLMYLILLKFRKSYQPAYTVLFFSGLICVMMFYYWVKKEIRSAYRDMVRENELRLLEESIDEKDKLIAALREDNERLAGIIHKDNKLIPAMVMSVRRFAQTPEKNAGDMMELAAQLDGIYAERANAVRTYESHGRFLGSTGVTSVDAVLSYMDRKADDNRVGFEFTLSTDVPKMLEEAANRREFNTILADLTENAIISARESADKRVAVRIFCQNDVYSLEVSDSGRQFDVDVLRSMGRRKITTHAGEGGSGIGLMTLFEVLRRSGSSLLIEEYPDGEQYTKRVAVRFDGNGCRTLISPRADELRRALGKSRFDIELPEKRA